MVRLNHSLCVKTALATCCVFVCPVHWRMPIHLWVMLEACSCHLVSNCFCNIRSDPSGLAIFRWARGHLRTRMPSSLAETAYMAPFVTTSADSEYKMQYCPRR